MLLVIISEVLNEWPMFGYSNLILYTYVRLICSCEAVSAKELEVSERKTGLCYTVGKVTNIYTQVTEAPPHLDFSSKGHTKIPA